MRRVLALAVTAVLATGGIAACNLTGGGACSGSQCVQEDDGDEWEIDIDGHKVRKTKAPSVVSPVKPVAPVKPVQPGRRGR